MVVMWLVGMVVGFILGGMFMFWFSSRKLFQRVADLENFIVVQENKHAKAIFRMTVENVEDE